MVVFLPYAFTGLAQLFVMAGGEVDLSLGAALSLINVSTVSLYGHGIDGPSLVLLPLAFGLGIGALNGVLVGFLNINSLLATIATMSVWQGLALLILPTPGGSVPYWLSRDITAGFGLLPSVVVLIAVLLLVWWAFKLHRLSPHIFSLGGNLKGAYFSGVKVKWTKFASFLLDGLMAGLAGLIVTGYASSGDPSIGQEFLIPSIVAVVIGGGSLYGGKGDGIATLLAGLGLGFLNSTLFSLTTLFLPPEISSFYKDLLYSIFLLVILVIVGLFERWRG